MVWGGPIHNGLGWASKQWSGEGQYTIMQKCALAFIYILKIINNKLVNDREGGQYTTENSRCGHCVLNFDVVWLAWGRRVEQSLGTVASLGIT